MAKQKIEAKVININRKGEIFNPAEYTIRRDEHPEFYKFLEEYHYKLHQEGVRK